MISEQTAGELNQLFGLDKSAPSRKLRNRWACPVPAQEMGDFFVMPLKSSKELASEAWHMQHCVASYGARCATGLYQVFSVRDQPGNRIATLGLTNGSNGWKVDQCLGFSNAEVMIRYVESMVEFTDLLLRTAVI